MSVVVHYTAPAAARATEEEAAKRLQRAAVFFVQQLQRRLSVPNPPPHTNSSKPGQYPRKRTGNLIANVVAAPLSVAGILSEGLKTRSGLNPGAPYGLILEFAMDRLGFVKAVEELRTFLNAILTTKAP